MINSDKEFEDKYKNNELSSFERKLFEAYYPYKERCEDAYKNRLVLLDKIQTLKAKVGELQKSRDDLLIRLNNLETQLKEAYSNRLTLMDKLKEKNQRIGELESDYRRLSTAEVYWETRCKGAEAKVRELENYIQKNINIDLQNGKTRELQELLEHKDDKIQTLEAKVKELEEKLNNAVYEGMDISADLAGENTALQKENAKLRECVETVKEVSVFGDVSEVRRLKKLASETLKELEGGEQ